MIIADLAPVRYRPKYIGMIMGVSGIGSMIGLSLGGAIVQHTTWSWIFWLNLPIFGLAAVMIFIFFRVKWNRDQAARQKLARVDWIGNFIISASTLAVMIALTSA